MVYSELPDPLVHIKTDKLCVLPGGGLLQLPGKLLLLLRICDRLSSCLVPLEDLVQSDLSRLVQSITQIWLLWSTIVPWVHLCKVAE